MHADNSKSSTDSGKDKRSKKKLLSTMATVGDCECDEEGDDGDDTGECCVAIVVDELESWIAATEDDAAVADVVHAPDGDQTEGYRAGEEFDPVLH